MIRYARVFVASVVLGVALFPVGPAAACSCALMRPHEYLEAATVVFTGEVVGANDTQATFAVDRIYKDQVSQPAVVESSGGCAVIFIVGERYTVFARGESGRLVTGLCDGTLEDPTLLAAAGIESIGSPSPLPDAAASDDEGGLIAYTEPFSDTSRAAPLALASMLALCAAAALLRFRPT